MSEKIKKILRMLYSHEIFLKEAEDMVEALKTIRGKFNREIGLSESCETDLICEYCIHQLFYLMIGISLADDYGEPNAAKLAKTRDSVHFSKMNLTYPKSLPEKFEITLKISDIFPSGEHFFGVIEVGGAVSGKIDFNSLKF